MLLFCGLDGFDGTPLRQPIFNITRWTGYIHHLNLIQFLLILRAGDLNDMALLNKSSQSYGVSRTISDHTVLPASRHKWTHAALITARQAGTRFTYPGGMEGWVDLGDWLAYIPRWFTRPQTVTHPSTTPPAHGRASNSRSADHKSDALTTTLPSHSRYC